MEKAEKNYLEKELYQLIKDDQSIFDFLQSGSLDGLWYWDLENPECEYMNSRFWELLGFNAQEKQHLSNEWMELIYPEDLETARLNLEEHCANPNHPYDQIVRYYHKDGSTIWVRCRGIAIRDNQGKPIRMLGAHNDITQLKNTEGTMLVLENQSLLLKQSINHKAQTLKSMEQQLRQQEKMAQIGELVGNIAHEVNSPLGLLLTILSMLRQDLEELKHQYEDQSLSSDAFEEFIKKHELSLQIGESNIKNASSILKSYKQLAVDQCSNLKSRFNLSEYIKNIIISFQPKLKNTPHKILCDIDPEIVLNSYPGLYSQILINLLNNSLLHGFTEQNEAGIINISAKADQHSLHLIYRDNGKGIPDTDLKKVFEKYYTTGRSCGGSGLGMNIIKDIVELELEGELTLESEVGKGVQFTITIPLSGELINSNKEV